MFAEKGSLHAATKYGNQSLVKELVGLGARVNQPGRLGASPLMCAIYRGHTDIVRLLLENGADVFCRRHGNTARSNPDVQLFPDIEALLDQNESHVWLVNLAILFRPLDLPVLATWEIYCAVVLKSKLCRTMSRHQAWSIAASIKAVEN